MPLSLKKVQQLIVKHDFIDQTYFVINNRIVFIEIIISEYAETILLYVSPRHELLSTIRSV